jgi:ribosomal protein L9
VNRKTVIGLVVGALIASQAAAQAPVQDKTSSDADKLEAAADQIARMKTAMKQVLARVEEARNEKDIVKLNCVNEKLTQIKALLKVAEQSDIALHEAVSNRDVSSDTEFSKIAIARSKVEGLRAESEQCIGQLAYIVDEKTTVEVQQPSDLPGAGSSEGSLGVARRGENPADAVAEIGTGATTAASAIGLGTRGTLGPGFVPPPVILPPQVSPHR